MHTHELLRCRLAALHDALRSAASGVEERAETLEAPAEFLERLTQRLKVGGGRGGGGEAGRDGRSHSRVGRSGGGARGAEWTTPKMCP